MTTESLTDAAPQPRRRLAMLLRREGWKVSAKRVYRLYREDGLTVRTKRRTKAALRQRRPLAATRRPNERWSMDFVHERLSDGRWFRILTVVDQFRRECVLLTAEGACSGDKVGRALEPALRARGAPVSITVDNGSEFASPALDIWAYRHGVELQFIRPGKPVENGYIESFVARGRAVRTVGEVGAQSPRNSEWRTAPGRRSGAAPTGWGSQGFERQWRSDAGRAQAVNDAGRRSPRRSQAGARASQWSLAG